MHVHTPASIVQHYGDSNQEETWETYIESLEKLPPEIKAIGVTDYFFVDGYSRLKRFKSEGRLKNIDLLLPVIELRIQNLVGHTAFRKVNYHVIFSNELEPEQINLFFLQELKIDLELASGKRWQGNVNHPQKLIELGKALRESSPLSKQSNETDLEIGFSNAAFSLRNIRDTLTHSMFEGMFLTAVGLGEWDQLRWDGGAAGVKKDIINGTNFVLTASVSPNHYQERRNKLMSQQVNNKLLDGSDAHYYATSSELTRLGNVCTWIKADLTFQGLSHAIKRFDDRVFVGDIPPKLAHVEKRKTKYIRSIEIRKKVNSGLTESWFDNFVPLNTELIAIIGNQGNGKSALTDIIALCGNSHATDFSFLSQDKFCDKQNRAQEFEATLIWEDGVQINKSLNNRVKETDVERIRYVPQGFFDTITNEKVVGEGGRFYGEIKKAIFSHIPESDRLECYDLDELLNLRTKEYFRRLEMFQLELNELNSKIAKLENECVPEKVQGLLEEINTKKTEIEAHKSIKPLTVEKPVENDDVNTKIIELRTEEGKLALQAEKAKSAIHSFKKQREVLKQTADAIQNELHRFDSFVKQRKQALTDVGIEEFELDQYVLIKIDTSPITFAIEKVDSEISKLEAQLNPDIAGSLAQKKDHLLRHRNTLETDLKQAGQEYQKYLNEIADWQTKYDSLIGSSNIISSLGWLENQLLLVRVDKPLALSRMKKERQLKCKEIHAQLVSFAKILEELTNSVQAHIKSHELTRDKYRIEFAIDLVVSDISEKLFSMIKQGTGTFGGIEEGRELLNQIANQYDFHDSDSVIDFAEDILDKLIRNYKNVPPTSMELSKLLKRGFKIEDVYNLLFGLEYIRPQYSLSLNGKSLKQLSPGDRGILLLVFYLIVDQGEEPLIIDQPEGNLNNQSIYMNLVPVFNEAKKRRQIIIVTHNPNLAVVCDAEQIIHAKIDFDDGNRVYYECGALENPTFNRLSVDVLEGTPPAFATRRITYGV